MPRRAKTPRLPATSPGQPYGVAGEQRAAMDVIPLPEDNPPPTLPPPPADAAPGGPPPAAPLTDLGAAVQGAMQMEAPTGDLYGPTQYPDQQLGQPYAAPVRRSTPTADVLRMVAESMGGDPLILQMADDAIVRGV